jgi:hypothetical protein
MATPTRPRNRDRIFHKALAAIIGGQAIGKGAGALTIGRLKSKIWVCAGAPTGAAPTGMLAKDIIYDTTNSDVYRWISDTTYIHITATA